jgi:predicted dehydrogenase
MTAPTPRAVRAALLGTGAWAKVLASAARGSRLDIACCYSPNAARRAAFAQTMAIPACHDIERVWNDRAIDAVVIAAPNAMHRSLAEQAAAHGKHVFVEKPIAHTLEDALAMVGLEHEHGIRLVVGHCARMLAGNRAIARAVREGDLGRVAHIEASFSNDRGLRLTPDDWRWHEAGAPGGPLSQVAIHQFDTLRALGGDLVAVSARSARLSPVGAEVADQWAVNVRFADDKLGSVVASWTSPGNYSVRVSGERASWFHEVDQALWSQPSRLHENAVLERQARGDGPGKRTRMTVPPGNMFRDELELFADAVSDARPCELTADNGLRALAAVNAAMASAARGGGEVLLDDVIAAARACTAAGGQPQPPAGDFASVR